MRSTSPIPTPSVTPLPASLAAAQPHEICNHLSTDGEIKGDEYFALVARATHDVVRDWDVKTGRVFWPQGLEPLGHEVTAATSDLEFWERQIHPQDRARTLASMRKALAGSAAEWSGEYRFRRADDSYLELLERAVILRDEAGGARRLIGSLMDLTTRKQLQNQLCHSQRMEAFGQLAGGVAHDFNNFLTAMLGYSDLLFCERQVTGVIAQYVDEIRNAAKRASALTAQLLAFSRRTALEPRVLEVNQLISKLERSMLRLLGENIWIESQFDHTRHGCYVKADPNELTQIILNLVVNARDAMPTGGRVLLKTECVTKIADTIVRPTGDDLPAGDYIVIGISDNGVGMSEEVQQHLFEPFFTTKDDGHGSGLGLAATYGIVRQSGGQIAIASELGRGTAVEIFLPMVSAPVPARHEKRNSKELPTGHETILVLEDDIGVRHISVKLLRSLGYDVIEAASGDDAQHLLGQRPEARIDLLLTDVVMPQMSGREFARWLGKTNPHTQVIFISGYLPESLSPEERQQNGMHFLPKPFDSSQLAFKVREVLDAKPTSR